MYLHNYIQTTHSDLLQLFLPEQLNQKSQWEVAVSKISYPSLYQNVTLGKFLFFDKNLLKIQNFATWNPVSTLPLRIMLKPWTRSFKKDTITTKAESQLKCLEERKSDIYLAIWGSCLAFFSADVGHIFRNKLGNGFGVIFRGKGPHKPTFAYDIVRIHSRIVYMDLIEYNILGDKKVLSLGCFPFISKLKVREIITTGQFIKYHTISNPHFSPLLKKYFHSIHIDLRDTSGEKVLFLFVGITRLVLMF